MTKLVVGSATDVGMVRSNNQDQYLVAPGLYAVADGMGGHAAGEVASQTAIEALRSAFEQRTSHTPASLVEAAKQANKAVWDRSRANRGMMGMGTTLVALGVVEDDDGSNGMAIAHIGDSRVYVFRDGALSQLTTDHSLVQELVDDGQISAEEATVHPQRHVLTRALGVEPSVQVDLINLSPQHGDRYLLCSDGLPREASSDQISAVLARFADPSEAAKELVSLANTRGGSDNVTVVVVDVMANDATGETLTVVSGPASTSPGSTPLPLGAIATDATVQSPVPVAALGTSVGAAAGGAQQQLGAPSGRAAKNRHQRGPGRSPRPITLRVVAFLLVFCLVVGGAIAGLAWYARSTYYVTISHGHITIFQGRPGGVLWFGPTLAERTRYTAGSVLASDALLLRQGQLEDSLHDARAYIARLLAKKRAAQQASHPSTTTTTGPPPKKRRTTTSSVATTSPTTPTTKARKPAPNSAAPTAPPA